MTLPSLLRDPIALGASFIMAGAAAGGAGGYALAATERPPAPATAAVAIPAGLEDRVSALESEVAATTRERDDWAAEAQGLTGAVASLTKERDDWAAEAGRLKGETDRLAGEVAGLQQQVSALQQQLDGYRAREGNRRRVFFLGGLDSTPVTARAAFTPLRNALLGAGYGEQDLRLYSYGGGSINGLGEYAADPYTCTQTRAALDQNVRRLANPVASYHLLRPDAEIALVGHSLGGRLALEAALLVPNRPRGVTIDSPLQGVGGPKALVAMFKGCGAATGVFNDLARSRTWPVLRPDLVLTVANRNDCLYKPVVCPRAWLGAGAALGIGNALGCMECVLAFLGLGGASDISNTQVAAGAQQYWAQLPRIDDFEASHGAALSHPSAIERIKAFIGPPM